MKVALIRVGVAAVLAALASLPPFGGAGVSAQTSPIGMALVGGTLLDGIGAAPLRDSVVLIRGDRIERVGTGTAAHDARRGPRDRRRTRQRSVSAGKYADVIAVGGDPLRHIDVLRDPKVVIRHGRRFK